MATITVLLLVSIAAGGVLILASTSVLQTRLAAAATAKLAGTTLAEAGVDDAVDRLRTDIDYSGGSGTLYEDPPTNSVAFGTFSTQVTAVDPNTKKVVSTGTYRNGKDRQVVALVDVTPRRIGFGAIVSKGDVKMGGTAQIVTTPLNQHVADVMSNGNVSMGGGSFTDGQLTAVGTVSGTAFYPSISGSDPAPFPTASEISAQQNAYANEARSTNNVRGAINNAGSNMTLTAPAYVNGSIDLKNGDSLTLNGGGGGVIYVNGNVNLYNGSTLTNGVTLVVSGTFTQNGGVFTTTTGVVPTPTVVVYSNQSDAINLTGGSAAQNQGVVYAVQGGIKLAGGATFTGALVAGSGGVTSQGNYYHYFPTNLASSATLPAIPTVKSWLEL
jgi:hypothetical protein